jgi:DNA-binding NtrC family response regulator
MPKVRALVAEEDMSLHQVVCDVLEMTFKDVAIERVMNPNVLLTKLRESGELVDLLIYNLHFDTAEDGGVLATVRREMPEMDDRIVLLVSKGDDVRQSAWAHDLPYVVHPLSLDDFIEAVTRSYERRKAALADEQAGLKDG